MAETPSSVAELSLDVDIYRSGRFEATDKQAKVRLEATADSFWPS